MNTELAPYLHFKTNPIAKNEAIIVFDKARFTILTSQMIRCEFSNESKFEDFASQHFICRDLEIPKFTKNIENNILTIETDNCILEYINDGRSFNKNNLSVKLKSFNTTWHYGDKDNQNLKGTARTLDNCNGDFNYVENEKVEISEGLISRSGWALVDDSETLVFPKNQMPEPRKNPDNIDCYLLAYENNYKDCLNDYYKVAGNAPLLPEWSLGIWWSKWEPFTQQHLENIVQEFEDNKVALSVCVVDMDWHLDGWTGYSWNNECFPNPKGFFELLHSKGIRSCLNLHPANGVAKHESSYAEFAEYMGMNPDDGETIEFDITDPKFINGYFKYLHHPLQKDGVDFWWMDWQQGGETTLTGLDPLWMLNHLHSLDIKRDGTKREFTFSRWGNQGAHRTPIGFSGDAARTWDTLEYQVEFTAQAANVAFGWWSHDIGGFSNGFENDELFVRWMQFGAISPIFRMHNCGDPTLDYRPWSKEEKYKTPAINALTLRRNLLAYIYSANWEYHNGGLPLCTPLYYYHPENEEAYICPGQYYFGKDLIVAPITESADKDTKLARKVIWLPEGEWFDFFTGESYDGNRWHSVYKDLNEQIIFAKAGSIIPFNDVEDQSKINLIVFPGNGKQEVYFDDGVSMNYTNGEYEIVTIKQTLENNKINLDISDKTKFNQIIARGLEKEIIKDCEDRKIEISLNSKFKQRETLTKIEKMLYSMAINPHATRRIQDHLADIANDIQKLAPFLIEFSESQIKAFVEIIADCGFHYIKVDKTKDVLCYWNKNRREDFGLRIARAAWLEYFDTNSKDKNLESETIIIKYRDAVRGWLANANYCNLYSEVVKQDRTGRV